MALYIALMFGAPLGEYALGGKCKVLPRNSRIACGVSILVQVFAILVLLQLGEIFSIGLTDKIAKSVGYFFSFYFVINIFMNILSKSKKERYVMTPISVIIAFCFLFTTIVA